MERPDCELDCTAPADYFIPSVGLTVCHVHALPYLTMGAWMWSVRRSCWER